LAEKEMSITDICFTVGFQSLGSFSALFAKRVGYPPAIYRTKLPEIQRMQRTVPYCFLVMNGLA
jgi:AraC-like DNA-binding protein